MYDTTVDICGIERLKTVKVAQAGEEVNPLRYQQAPAQRTEASPRERIANANKKPFTNCADVVEGMKGVKVHGKLLTDPVDREVNTAKGPAAIRNIMIDDGTAQLRITFWNLSKVPILKAGDEITVDSLMGKAPYDGTPQASGGDYVKIAFEKV